MSGKSPGPLRAKTWARCAIVAIASIVAADAWAAAIYVDVTNESGVEDGTPAHPYNTIQEGIDNASQGDRVVVAPGQYKETVLMSDGVSVVGSDPQTTIIDGTGLQNSVVTFDKTRQNPLLRNFTIKAGHGELISESGGVPVYAGGGILILDSSPVVSRNVITQNTITEGFCLGGGIYVRADGSSPQIMDNVISDNVALSSTQPGSGEGGGIYIVTKNGNVVIEGNLFESNQAVSGGAIYIENASDSTVQIKRNIVRSNDAENGGAVLSRALDGSVTTIVNNLILGNGSAAASAQGGGISAYALATGGFSIVNNTLVDNSVSAGNGGAIWLDDSLSSYANIATNNVITGNTALHGGGIDYTAFFGEIRNNDFDSNAGGDLYDGGGSGATLLDNLFSDPGFVSPAQDNYRLDTGSPCIDAALESAAPADDLDGFSRPFDGDGDMTDVSDIGAYEYPGGEVFDLVFVGGGELGWQMLGSQDSYNLYRGSLDRLRSTGEYTQDPLVEPMAATFCDVLPTEVPFADAFTPTSGAAVFYLVTAVTGNWEGPLGVDSLGLRRPNDNPCP